MSEWERILQGASFIGVHLAHVKWMRLRQREGHSYVLDTATANLGLLSQRADGGLVHAITSHVASYFYLSSGNPRNYSVSSGPCTHLRHMWWASRLFLKATDFEAGWPVIDSDSKWMVQRLRCLLREPKGKQNKVEQTGKFGVNRSEAFKVFCPCSSNTPIWSIKTTQ